MFYFLFALKSNSVSLDSFSEIFGGIFSKGLDEEKQEVKPIVIDGFDINL